MSLLQQFEQPAASPTRSALHQLKVFNQLQVAAARSSYQCDLNQVSEDFYNAAHSVAVSLGVDTAFEPNMAWIRNAILPLACSSLERTGRIEVDVCDEAIQFMQAGPISPPTYSDNLVVASVITLQKLSSLHANFSYLRPQSKLTNKAFSVIDNYASAAAERVGDDNEVRSALITQLTELYVAIFDQDAEKYRLMLESESPANIVRQYGLGFPTDDLFNKFDDAASNLIEQLGLRHSMEMQR
ncbi:hypothetical protein [Marinobacterium jannaschii]|uniref:hypothetical protein n=1 Tax=Marinobacterium jannaschii TaxID=64970 RepID=UPI00048848E6|nr:hypothetical protein [Marinobacterium jannaschii]